MARAKVNEEFSVYHVRGDNPDLDLVKFVDGALINTGYIFTHMNPEWRYLDTDWNTEFIVKPGLVIFEAEQGYLADESFRTSDYVELIIAPGAKWERSQDGTKTTYTQTAPGPDLVAVTRVHFSDEHEVPADFLRPRSPALLW